MHNSRLKLIAAIEAALSAGDHMVQKFGTQIDIIEKTSPMDVVTDVDFTCNRIIEQVIHQTFPDDKILSEELQESFLYGRNCSSIWIIDPLDGTTNFTRSIAFSSVSIGYMENGAITMGVIYDPYHKEFFFSLKGQGARYAKSSEIIMWLNAEPNNNMPGKLCASMSKEFDSRTALVALGIPSDPERSAVALSKTLKLIPYVKGIRDFGSSALHLAYVAAGRLDAYVAYGQFVWDYSAGLLLVQEAGGFVTFPDGEDNDAREVIASRTQDFGYELITLIS
ncbi:inositol monophosphatase family protein [Dictyobacter aurantiacus]|uniref:Inositol-1-monophosphatase n=1 Tax=Dictyobacter aurantiacus TaxID=1936993 RepID=A0A401ZAL1_9CHLR|nr:inositol monophosphatase family protein [Dictyobacter aurantiacus]GCE03846.1 inositol-1-monophosphatase [Dictyobacter aurantiacus]